MRIAFQGRLELAVVTLGLVFTVLSVAAPAGDSLSAPNAGIAVPIPHPMTMLLHAESVFQELRLTAAQKAALAVAADQVDLPLWRMRDLPPDERNRSASGLLGSLRAKLSATLALRQMERLDELVLRASGPRAVLEPTVAAALDLSNRQKQRIQVILASSRWNTAPADRLRVQAEQDILAVLSDRQRRTFAGLQGPPFDLAAVRAVACRAPELEGVTAWINTPPLTLAQGRGKVIVLHFYTFGCSNCIRNLPHYNHWRERFDPDRLVIVGIHRPETQEERDVEQVRRKAAEAGQKYAIAVDNDSRNWEAWANRVWPSVYLIDKSGFVRYWWYGELNWQGTPGEKWMRDRIAELLTEPGAKAGSTPASAP